MTDITDKDKVSGTFGNHRNIWFALPGVEQTLVDRSRQNVIPRQVADRTRINRDTRHVVLTEQLIERFIMKRIEPVQVPDLHRQADVSGPLSEECLQIPEQLWGITRRQLQEHGAQPRPELLHQVSKSARPFD